MKNKESQRIWVWEKLTMKMMNAERIKKKKKTEETSLPKTNSFGKARRQET